MEETDTTPVSLSWLEELPTASSPLDELVDYPATTYPGEETMVISTRVPISWAAQFEEFRDKIGSRMPKKIWARNSDLARWCIGFGFKHLRRIQEQLDSGQLDPTPLLAVQHFLEETGGRLAAHASIRADARAKARRIAEALTDMIRDGEEEEATNLVLQWFDGARAFRATSTYWENTLILSLLKAPGGLRSIAYLCEKGYIVDPEICSLASSGLITEEPLEENDADRS